MRLITLRVKPSSLTEDERLSSRSKPRSVTDDAATSPYAAKPWLAHYDYWTRPHVNYPRRPLYEILRMTAVTTPDLIATAFLGAHLSYGQIKEQSDKLATALVRLGIKQNDRVGIMLPNCPQYMIATFAILRLGATVVNVNPLYTPREVAVVAKDSGMRMLFALDLLSPVVFAARGCRCGTRVRRRTCRARARPG